MRLMEEVLYDLDFREPKVVVSQKLCIIENVDAIVMIGESSLTVETAKKYVTVKGSGFVIKEIFEGRLLIEGTIQGVEFFRTSGENKD